IYPFTKMDESRMVKIVLEYGVERMVINSAADWGVSDPLMVPKTVVKLRQAGVSDEDVEKLVWHNPVDFFAQGGRFEEAELDRPAGVDLRETYEGNSVLRGQDPDKA